MEAASVPATAVRKKKKSKPPRDQAKTPWWLWVAVAAIVLFCLIPFYWLVNISLKTGADLSTADIIPPSPSLDNYTSIFENSDFTRSLANSAIVALVTTFLGIVVGAFAAYALARLKMRGKAILLAIVLSITTFPQIAIAAPLFRLWTDIGLYNTLIGLIIPYLCFALPLSIYILVSFFREIPRDLEEAALVDGATYFQAFRKVVVPLAAPGLATDGDPDVHRGVERVPARHHADLVALGTHLAGGDLPVHGLLAVRGPAGDPVGGLGGHLDPADHSRAHVPEADRRRAHRRRGEGVMRRG